MSLTPGGPHPSGLRRRVLVAALIGMLFTGLLSLWATTLAGREISAPPALLAAAVMVLPFLWSAHLGLCVLAWALVPNRPALAAVLSLSLATMVGLWGPAWLDHAEVIEGTSLRMMTWNVRRLWGHPSQERSALGCVTELIAAEAPDVITLLEASRRDIDLLDHRLALQCVHGTYRFSRSRRIGGLAVCVRRGDWVLERGNPQRFVDNDDWHYVFAEIRNGKDHVNVLAVHLAPYGLASPSEIARRQSGQARALLQRMKRLSDPTVLAGDFNSTRDAALHVDLRKRLNDTWERGAFGYGSTVDVRNRLPLRVDYIYASPAFAVRDSHVPQVSCSDHRPVVSDLTLRP